MAERLTLPGFVNAHSHAFQRALRGSAAGDVLGALVFGCSGEAVL